MRNRHVKLGRIIFLDFRKGPDVSGDPNATDAVLEKELAQKLFEGQNKKLSTVLRIFSFRKNDYKSAKNTEFLARSIFSNSAKIGPLMANDRVLES